MRVYVRSQGTTTSSRIRVATRPPVGTATVLVCCLSSANRRAKESSADRAMSTLMSRSKVTSIAGSTMVAKLRAEVECVSFVVAMKCRVSALSCHARAERSSWGTATSLLQALGRFLPYRALHRQSRLSSEVLLSEVGICAVS